MIHCLWVTLEKLVLSENRYISLQFILETAHLIIRLTNNRLELCNALSRALLCYYLLRSNHLSQRCPVKSFENTVGKAEITLNKQFLLFPQCFLPLQRIFCNFHQNLKIIFCKLFQFQTVTVLNLSFGNEISLKKPTST